MSRIEQAFKTILSMERGDPQPTMLNKLAIEHQENLRKRIDMDIKMMLTDWRGFDMPTSWPKKQDVFRGVVRADKVV